jgi:chaperonin cofactor prefoldin
LLHCKNKKVVASENLASVNLYEKQSNTIESHEEMVVTEFAEISPIIEQKVLESSCDADVE